MLRNDDQPGIERRRRKLSVFAAILIGAATTLLVLIGVGVALVTLAANDLSLVGESRPRLNPITIAATACPQVRIIHLTADGFQLALGSAESGTDQHGQPMSWPVARNQLDTAMQRLDTAITNGAPHFPEAIRTYLTTTQLDLRAGRTQLGVSRDAQDMTSRTQTLLDEGKTAYGNASDLVGQQCDVPLRADTSTGWFTTTTTPTTPTSPGTP
jgi:hypothetical protein